MITFTYSFILIKITPYQAAIGVGYSLRETIVANQISHYFIHLYEF
jgi:hypothetical protein